MPRRLAQPAAAEVHPQATLSPERIAELIGGAMEDPARSGAMAAAAKSVGKADATRLLADLAEAIASGERPFRNSRRECAHEDAAEHRPRCISSASAASA
jgi:hypothetical protein